MMLRRALLAVWEFVAGDDWRVALGIVVTLGSVALLAALGLPAWWLGPLATLAILQRSVMRAAGA
jgi:hypothetical protein